MTEAPSLQCKFGREEHDGSRFCHEHIGFLQAGEQARICDRHPSRTDR